MHGYNSLKKSMSEKNRFERVSEVIKEAGASFIHA